MSKSDIINKTKKKLLNHYSNQVDILEVESEDDTIWYKLHMKEGFFIPMHKHELIEVDFDESTVKMYTSIEVIDNPC
jgi:hypothetical protein